MRVTVKALCLGLLASLAVGFVAVVNAPAESGGHFASEASHTRIEGWETLGSEHRLE